MNKSGWPSATVIVLLLAFSAPLNAQEIKRVTIMYDAFGPPSTW